MLTRFCFLFTALLAFLCSAFLISGHANSGAVKPAEVLKVNSTLSLYQAISQANKFGNTTILVAKGQYKINKTINVTANNISIIAESGDPTSTRFIGNGMRKTKHVDNLIRVSAKHFVLDGLGLSDVGNHLIQIASESDADYPIIRNCILQDSYEQLLKVSSDPKSSHSSDNGLVENCIFQYSKGMGPQFYIGGIDAHNSRNWVVQNNLFRDIASPDNKTAQHAIHFWNKSSDILVKNNVIIDCDRGIGFGMRNRPAYRGIIIGNLIVHSANNDPNADVGIIIEETTGTRIINNRIYLTHDYPNTIEYRFPTSKHIEVINNITNKAIRSRNGAKASLLGNKRVRDIEEIVTAEEFLRFDISH
jgi:hypothetical protein